MSNVDINVDRRTDGLTDGRTDGQKIGRLYRTLLQAGAIKTMSSKRLASNVAIALSIRQLATEPGILDVQYYWVDCLQPSQSIHTPTFP